MMKHPEGFDHLRQRADARREKPVINVENLSNEDSRRLAHELQTYQIELELQNEDLRRAQGELLETRDRYTDLYDFAPVGYMTIGPSGLIREANLKLCDMLGVARAVLLRTRVTAFIYPDDEDVYYKHRREALGSALGATCQLRMIPKDDNPFWVEMSSVAVRESKDDDNNVRIIVVDVSERRALEAQVAQADRLASLGLLAAGVAHEINNPLTYVLFNIENLGRDLPKWAGRFLESAGSPRERNEIEDLVAQSRSALDGVRRIRDITRNLQFFSHMDQEQMARLSIREVIDAAVSLARNQFRYKAKFVSNYDPLPEIIGNSGSLCQVFLNILVNAAHAIEEGNVEQNEIRICTRLMDGNIVIEIHDTGCGIPESIIDQIFDPFFTTKEIGVGSGLGLPICSNIIRAHGGSLSVRSTLGQGSCFTVQLPTERNPSAEETPAKTKEKKYRAPAVKGRVLIVDDEPFILEALSALLEEHEVHRVSSGQEAQELIQTKKPFDVVLCDLMMPGFTGMDLYSWVMEAHPEVASRIVFITGGGFTPRAQQFLTDVPNPRLEKPFDAQKLRLIVNNLMLAG